ncbi:MAG: glycosyl transferase, group 1 [Acidobacteria bacterium]|nr:glycosyl transferase, group 1 [Acidobacteriota bacterium]
MCSRRGDDHGRMRIGVDIYQTGFPFGGIARYVRALVSAMAAAAPSDRFVLVSNHFRRNHAPWRHPGPNVTHVDLQVPRRLMQTCWNRIGWPPMDSFAGPLDIFHGTHFVLPPVRTAKRVLTVHDLTFLRHPEYFSDGPLNLRGHRMELPAALKHADVIIAPSDYTRRALIELMKVPEDRIRVIPEGVEAHFFVSQDRSKLQEVKDRLGLSRPYLIFLVGTPEPRKNLLRTVAASRLAAPDLDLVIIGPKDPIRSLLEGDARGVHLIGSLSEEDLPYVLHGAVLSLYPSLAEGFGLPALESLAAGVPLVTSDRTAVPEVVGEAAVRIEPESIEEIAQAIRSLLGDEDRRRRLVEAGKARAREFSWERSAREVLSLYGELVPCRY